MKSQHNKNIYNLRKRHGMDTLSNTKPPENVIHNFSPNDLTEEEIQALSNGLD